MYLVSDGTISAMNVPAKHNTLKQAQHDLATRLKSHHPFCHKYEQQTLTHLLDADTGLDRLTDRHFADTPAMAWVIDIGGITRIFRIEVHYG
jgi:hypothetical protein